MVLRLKSRVNLEEGQRLNWFLPHKGSKMNIKKGCHWQPFFVPRGWQSPVCVKERLT
jgi:hypothetical protein